MSGPEPICGRAWAIHRTCADRFCIAKAAAMQAPRCAPRRFGRCARRATARAAWATIARGVPRPERCAARQLHSPSMSSPDHSPADFVPVRIVPVGRPLRWLVRGWRDFTRVPAPSALHGVVVAAGGIVILFVTLRHWYLLPGAFSGFLLIGPILATGLYELSRRLAADVPRPTLADAT